MLNSTELHHVFLQGYYMPSIFSIYSKYTGHIKEKVIIRLHVPDRKGIEKKTQKKWNEIVAPKTEEVNELIH